VLDHLLLLLSKIQLPLASFVLNVLDALPSFPQVAVGESLVKKKHMETLLKLSFVNQ